MSTEQSPDAENNNVNPADEMPPPPPVAPAVQETPPPAPAPAAPAAPATSAAKDKKILAGILAIVLGAYGVHKFILGYKNEGIIMLVASLVGIIGSFLCFPVFLTIAASIIGIVEGIMYLTKSDEEFDRIYIQGRKPWF